MYTFFMKKILFCLLLITCFTSYSAFSLDPATALYRGEEYSIFVTYTEIVQPGDPVIVKMDFEPNKELSKENYSETKAVLVFEDKTKSDFFDLEGNAKRNSNTPLTLCALLPLSTWQNAGAYTVTVMYSAYGRDYKKFSLPISIEKKDFVSETIELDSKNTDIKTDVSPARMNQIERLNDILFTVDSASVYLNSAFVPPTTATRRTSFFGDRRVYAYTGGGSSTSLHYGIDYGIPTGSEVTACGQGRVVMAENRISTGWSIVIEHLPGVYSLYYHMDSLTVEKGDMVKQGTLIGYSGATGLATGPHLHWEVRVNGNAVNPDFFVSDEFPFFEK